MNCNIEEVKEINFNCDDFKMPAINNFDIAYNFKREPLLRDYVLFKSWVRTPYILNIKKK